MTRALRITCPHGSVEPCVACRSVALRGPPVATAERDPELERRIHALAIAEHQGLTGRERIAWARTWLDADSSTRRFMLLELDMELDMEEGS